LHEQGKLWDIYHELRNRNSLEVGKDPAGLDAIGNLLKQPMPVVSNNFSSWIKKSVDPVKVPKNP
jgi:hypothetical protein